VNDTGVIPPYDDHDHAPGSNDRTPDVSTSVSWNSDIWNSDIAARSAMGTSDAADAFRPTTAGADTQLSTRDQQILAFERQWWKYAGAKEQAIRELFDMSATRYYQVLNALIDRPEALATDPMLVKRLRRLRSARQRARSARRLGIEV
jgi:hypothetical protein